MFRDTMDTWYALGENDTPRVGRDVIVAAGDVIATGPDVATIVAYAAALGLAVDAAAEAIARHDGTAYTAGTPLGARRSGLRTRTVSASVSGPARGFARSGALAIRDTTAVCEHRARYGGIVRDINERAIIVTSEVARCEYAFADATGMVGPLHIEPALLDGALTDEEIEHLPEPMSIVIAHIAEIARLKSVTRSFHGTLFVGSVTASVAWSLLERSPSPESQRGKNPSVVVLSGAGDVQDGIRAAAPFRHLHGAQAMLDRFTQTITVISPGMTLPDSVTDPHPSQSASAARRDPANDGTSDAVHGTSRFAISGIGKDARALRAGTAGEARHAPPIPAQNLHRF